MKILCTHCVNVNVYTHTHARSYADTIAMHAVHAHKSNVPEQLTARQDSMLHYWNIQSQEEECHWREREGHILANVNQHPQEGC